MKKTTYYCDKCGKEVDPAKIVKIDVSPNASNTRLNLEFPDIDIAKYYIHSELCMDCYEELDLE